MFYVASVHSLIPWPHLFSFHGSYVNKTNPLLTEVYGIQSDSRRVNYSRDRLMNNYHTELIDGFQMFNVHVPHVGASIFRRVLEEIVVMRLGYSKATVVCQQRAL